MELNLSEEKAKELWDDERLISLIRGCKHVMVSIDVSRQKYLVLHPVIIIFNGWKIELDAELSGQLLITVDIFLVPKKQYYQVPEKQEE